jgi:hypothetical protein
MATVSFKSDRPQGPDGPNEPGFFFVTDAQAADMQVIDALRRSGVVPQQYHDFNGMPTFAPTVDALKLFLYAGFGLDDLATAAGYAILMGELLKKERR